MSRQSSTGQYVLQRHYSRLTEKLVHPGGSITPHVPSVGQPLAGSLWAMTRLKLGEKSQKTAPTATGALRLMQRFDAASKSFKRGERLLCVLHHLR
jgi:hypothetical protein